MPHVTLLVRALLVLAGMCCSSACSVFTSPGDMFAAKPLNAADALSSLHLVALLNPGDGGRLVGGMPGGGTTTPASATTQSAIATTQPASTDMTEELAKALNTFYQRGTGEYPSPEHRRNDIQDLLLAAAYKQCEDYITLLKTRYASTNLFYSVVSTIAGTIGAIVTGGAASAFSGLAGAASGVRSQNNEITFGNQTIEIIATGIRTARDRQIKQILEFRKPDALPDSPPTSTPPSAPSTTPSQTPASPPTTAQPTETTTTPGVRRGHGPSIEEYTVAAAVGDVLAVHNTCSMEVGLNEAAAAIKQVRQAQNEGKANLPGSTATTSPPSGTTPTPSTSTTPPAPPSKSKVRVPQPAPPQPRMFMQ